MLYKYTDFAAGEWIRLKDTSFKRNFTKGIVISMEIFDSHAHYHDAAFDDDRDALLAALPEKGVVGIINAADSIDSAAVCVRLAETHPYIYAAAGVHPEMAAGVDADTLETALQPFLAHEKTVAIGEIGLDYHYEDACPRAQQLAVFEAQLALAVKKNLPVIVHDREAHADTLRLLQQYRPCGVVHCFSGSVEMLREVLKIGMYIGLGGVVTFKNARQPLEVAAAVPADRLLLETDAPYMAPTPFRGQRCDSSLIPLAAEKIAALRGVTADEILHTAAANTRRLFGIR